MGMAVGASATTRPPIPPLSSAPSPSSSSPKTVFLSEYRPKSQFKLISGAVLTSTTHSILPLFPDRCEAKAFSLSKEQIVSSLTQVENTIDQGQVVGSNFLGVTGRFIQVVIETVKPGVEVALPILQKAGEQVVKVASPAISEASKKAQEAIQSSGLDTEPVINVENTIEQVQVVGLNSLNVAGRFIQVVVETVKPGIDMALPLLQKAGEEAVKVASPAISEASKIAQEAIQSVGLDTEPVINVAKTVAGAAQQTAKFIEEAKPIASSAVEIISSTDPIAIVGASGALFLAYLLLPPICSTISYSLHGYRGDLTPAETLDLISTKNCIMIDIRLEKENDNAGLPRSPPSSRNKMIAVPLEELPSKLRGLVRNAKKLEAEVIALKISYLKKISKNSNIVIVGSCSDSAKIVARALTRLGFKNCWMMVDGFSRNRGWL